jgi:hypothetical protein
MAMVVDDKLAVALLRGARLKLQAPGGWTQGALARNREGHPLAPESEAATSFCVYGALRSAVAGHVRAAGHHKGLIPLMADAVARFAATVAAVRLGARLYRFSPARTLVEWNDAPGRTQAQALELATLALEGFQVQHGRGDERVVLGPGALSRLLD